MGSPEVELRECRKIVSKKGAHCLLLFSCAMSRVTLTAVSVVICLGPSRRPSKPFFLNSEVLSAIGQFGEYSI